MALVTPLILTALGGSIVSEIRTKLDVPAMGMITIENGVISEPIVEGNTRVGFRDPIDASMPWHLGSNTKAVTAALTGLMIQDGKFKFDTKVVDYLELDTKQLAEGWKDLTVRMLLEQTSGVTKESYPGGFGWYEDKRPLPVQRLEYSRKVFSEPPKDMGTFGYANANYVILAALAEKASGKDWEALIRERFFKPLDLVTAGIGPCPAKAPQPHKTVDGKFALLDVGDVTDNAPVLASASSIYMSLGDYAKWMTAVLDQSGPLTKDSWRNLMTPTTIRGTYAGGWILVRDHGITRFITHCGSNTMNTTACWIDVTNRRAIAMCANAASEDLMKEMNTACMNWAAKRN